MQMLTESDGMGNKFKNPYIDQIYEYPDIIVTTENRDTLNGHTFLGPKKDLIVDIGCGSGNFLRDYAMLKPNSRFIGFEMRFKRLVKGAVKFRKHNVTNVRLIRAKAEEIADWIKPDSIFEVHINFPDPWAKKKRQRKHRLITAEYLSKIHSLMVRGGCLIFKTDHEEYFHWVKKLLKLQPALKMVEYSEDLHHSKYNEKNIPTEFELLFKKKGYPVFYLKTQA